MEKDGIVRVVIVGCGDRGMIYGREARSRKGQFQIVGIAEPDPARRTAAAAAFGLPPERCLACADDIAREPKFADAVFNCTMDAIHVDTSIPLLRRGYDMLLENVGLMGVKYPKFLADMLETLRDRGDGGEPGKELGDAEQQKP